MAVLIALLRAVNVGGRKVGMAELRAACKAGGLGAVKTYIASGNLVLRGEPEDAEELLEALIQRRFGFDVPVIVRTAEQWATYVTANPFPVPATQAPSRLFLAVSKALPSRGAAEGLTGRAMKGEVVARCRDALVLHCPEGIGSSKLTPGLIDRLVGSPTTLRNWNTVLALARLSQA